MSATISNPFIVQVVAAPPPSSPGSTPVPVAEPLWLKGVPLFHWIDIPNSVMLTTEATKGLDPGYMASIFAGTSQATPSRTNHLIVWPQNKLGLQQVGANQEYSYYNLHYTYASIGYDSGRYSGRPANMLVGMGDAHWPDNSVPRFVFGVDKPYWEIAVQGTHARNYRNQVVHSALEDPAFGAVLPSTDDPRWYRHFDGSPRPGHSYFGIWVLERDKLLVKVGAHQFYPVDVGYQPDMVVGDLSTGKWNTQNPSPLPSYTTAGLERGDETPWKTKHPITEDIWGVYNSRMGVFRRAPRRWEALWNDPTGYAWDNAVGAVDWEHEYILGCSFYALTSERTWWTFPTVGANPTRLQVSIAGPYAHVLNQENVRYAPYRAPKAEGMLWCPDLQKFMWYRETVAADPKGNPPYEGFAGNAIYTLERQNSGVFYVDRLNTSGTLEGVPYSGPAQGGILNRFQYCHSLKGVFWRPSDWDPVKFMKTG